MKGDFSKIRYGKKKEFEKNYRKVHMQQGRVLTDSDWNDQIDIQDYHDRIYLKDIIGKSGISLEEPNSFEIIPGEGRNYTIGKGRIYVDGILVENHYDVEGKNQPNLPISLKDGLSAAIPDKPGFYLAYLDVWNRHITYLDDPDILESALGGTDTTSRSQIIWQVKLHNLANEDIAYLYDYLNNNDGWKDWKYLGKYYRQLTIGKNENGTLCAFSINSDFHDSLFPNDAYEYISVIGQTKSEPESWEKNWYTFPDFRGIFFGSLKQIKIGYHKDGRIVLFAICSNYEEKKDFVIFASQTEINSDKWDPWKKIGESFFNVSEVEIEIQIGYHKDGRIVLFTVEVKEESGNSYSVIFASQTEINSDKWDPWKKIGESFFNVSEVEIEIGYHKDGRILLLGVLNVDKKEWSHLKFASQTEINSDKWDPWKDFEVLNISSFRNAIQMFIYDAIISYDQNQNIELFVTVAVTFENYKFITFVCRSIQKSPFEWSKLEIIGEEKNQLFWNRIIYNLSSSLNTMKDNRLELFAIISEYKLPLDPKNVQPHENPPFNFNNWNQSIKKKLKPGEIYYVSQQSNKSNNLQWNLIGGIIVRQISIHKDFLSRIKIFAVTDNNHIYHLTQYSRINKCDLQIPSWNQEIQASNGKICARVKPDLLKDDICTPIKENGYKSLENQLYRIEIHESKTSNNKATFKWSRDNGIVCTLVVEISGEKVTVLSIGKDKFLGFEIEQWFEITDDRHELWGKPGTLAKIKNISDNNIFFDTSSLYGEPITSENFPIEFHPKIRRWDSSGVIKVDIQSENDGFILLENGIEVKFSKVDDIYKTGDYWLIPARTPISNIEWPLSNGNPIFLNNEGITHHYVPLVLLKFIDGNLHIISDYRSFFHSLTKDCKTNYKLTTWWLHGNICQVEYPGRGRLFRIDHDPYDTYPTSHKLNWYSNKYGANYRGWGFHFEQNLSQSQQVTYNWFHFPIQNLVTNTLSNIYMLDRIYILYETINCHINEIHIWDGGTKIKEFINLNLSGDHSIDIDQFNTFIISNQIKITRGIGVSVRVEFTKREEGEEGGFRRNEITFTNVGVGIRHE